MSSLEQHFLLKNKTVKIQDRTLLLRYMVLVNLIVGAWYLSWRWTQSLNTEALWFAIPLICAETYMFFGGVIFLTGLWRPLQRSVRSLNALLPPLSEADYPTIDIFITCYNEPVEIVAETTQAALNIDYPVDKLRVYILDDGNAPEMRAMSEQLCLKDLQTPALRRAAERLEQERNLLTSRLRQLQMLKQDLLEVEGLLHSSRLQVASEYQKLSEVMAWLNAAREATIPNDVWIVCQTILGEGFDNVVSHAHQTLPPTTPIELEISIFNHGIILRIWDQGPAFDLESHQQGVAAEVDVNAERGRGLKIIRELTDYFAYVRTSGDRNCLVMLKEIKTNETAADAQQDLPYKGYLQSLRQLLLLSQTEHHSTLDIYNAEIRNLEQRIGEFTHQLVEMPRCRYIAREKPKGRPHHAKAGNINNAIFSGETHGEFILTLDADHIPKPNFLQRVIPHFLDFNVDTGKYESNRVAFVQTPQAFYNLPADDPFGHNATFFYGPIQQSKDGMNAAFYTGTNAVLRREALVSMGLQHFAADFAVDEQRLAEFEMIGALSSISITEDMNTAMRLHATGWRSVYHDEILAEGLAPDDLSSTLKQKLRWAQGTIQVLLRDNPLFKSGLNFGQRLQYFQTMYSYFSGFFVCVFLLCPIISLTTGIIPVNAFGAEFALHFVPAYILNRLTFLVASWGISIRELWRNEQYAIALFPLQIQAVISVFTGKQIKFQVTPKQRNAGVYFSLIPVQLGAFCLTIFAMIYGLFKLIYSANPSVLTYIVNVAWCFYHIALLWSVIRAAYWQPDTQS